MESGNKMLGKLGIIDGKNCETKKTGGQKLVHDRGTKKFTTTSFGHAAKKNSNDEISASASRPAACAP